MFSINSNSMFTDFLPCARHDSRLRRSINEQKRRKSGKGGKEISVWETGSKNNSSKGIWRKKKKKELNSLEFLVGWCLLVTY